MGQSLEVVLLSGFPAQAGTTNFWDRFHEIRTEGYQKASNTVSMNSNQRTNCWLRRSSHEHQNEKSLASHTNLARLLKTNLKTILSADQRRLPVTSILNSMDSFSMTEDGQRDHSQHHQTKHHNRQNKGGTTKKDDLLTVFAGQRST